MAGVSSTIALNRWDSIVKQTQPVFDDIESGDFTNRDLAKVAQLLRKQSKLASTVFEQNLKLLSEQAKTYVPAVKQELAKIGEFVSPKNISIVIEAIYKELVAKNIKTIVDKIKEIINSDVVKKFQETAKSFYNDYAKFYGKVPVIDIKKDQVVASSAKKDVSDTDGLMQKVYDSLANISKAIVDLPSNISTQVAQDLLPKIKDSLGDKNIAKDVSGESPTDETVPLPAELQEKLKGQIDPNYWAKKGFVPWLAHGIKDFIYEQTHTKEEIEQEIKDFIDNYSKDGTSTPLPLNIAGLDLVDDKVRAQRRFQAQQDIAAVWGETDEAKAEKVPAWKEFITSIKQTREEVKQLKANVNKGFSNVATVTKGIVSKSVDTITNVTGAKYIAGIKGLVEGFHDKLEDKVDAIKKFASKTGNLFNTLITGGILAYVLYNFLIKKIDWGKVGTKIIKSIFPGLDRNTDKNARENQPDYASEDDTSMDGLRQGYGQDKNGNDVFTVRDEFGTFHTVHKDKDGNVTMSESDTDPRLMQTGEYAGYQVKQQGYLTDIGMDDAGTYTDFVHPETGHVRRRVELADGTEYELPSPTGNTKTNPSMWEAIKKKYFGSKDKEQQEDWKEDAVKSVPPDFNASNQPADSTSSEAYAGRQENLQSSSMRPGLGGRVTQPSPAVTRPMAKEAVDVKPVVLPDVKNAAVGGKVDNASTKLGMFQYDPMNLRTTRANGNKSDETLGLLNGRDF